MTDREAARKLREGYQPRANQAKKSEVTKGYGVTQPVDLSNLKIPKNLGSAAVSPRGGNAAPVPLGAKKG